jgi:hypothetical protein
LRVTLLLCDAAEEVGGKLYVLGGGWALLQAPDTPLNMALAILIAVPWDQANEEHDVEAVLVTDDGERVQIEAQEVSASGQFEAGRPPGLKPGMDLNVPIALKFNGIALMAGGYRWEVFVDGEQRAIAPFRVLEGVP